MNIKIEFYMQDKDTGLRSRMTSNISEVIKINATLSEK